MSARDLGPVAATLLVAGNMIGSGVYLLPATLAAYGSSSVIGWGLAAAAALVLAFVFARLARIAPDPDGLVAYPTRALGRVFGAQAGLAYLVACWVGNCAIAVAAVGALAVFVPAVGSGAATTAAVVATIWLVAAWCLLGARSVAVLAGVTLAIGLAPLAVASTAGWLAFDPAVFAASWNPSGAPVVETIPRSVVTVFWAFLGLESAVVAAAAVRDPERNVPLAGLCGVALAAVVYALATTVIMGVIPAADLARSSSPFADLAARAVGPAAGAIVAACVLVRAVGCLAGWTLVTAQASRAAAAQGLIPRRLSSLDPARTPRRDILLAATLMSTAAILSAAPTVGQRFGVLINVSTLLYLAVFALCCLSLPRLDQARRAWAPAALGVIACAGVIAAAPPVELGIAAAILGALALLGALRSATARSAGSSGSLA